MKTCPEKTAIGRRTASAPAKYVIKNIVPKLSPGNVFDWGCGRGKDIEFYNERGLNANGYDCNDKFGFTNKPAEKYDLITCVYVLNVMEGRLAARARLLEEMATHLTERGEIFIAARSAAEINKLAEKKGWTLFCDGFITSKSRKTFQHGISEQELIGLCGVLDLELEIIKGHKIYGAICALIRKKNNGYKTNFI